MEQVEELFYFFSSYYIVLCQVFANSNSICAS